jgi:uncharacterized membrane protein YfcA
VSPHTEEPGAAARADERPAAWFLPAGVLIGFAGALCGIGGGIFAGPLLHATRRLPLGRAAATALVVVLATTLAATVAELFRDDSQLLWPVVWPLALGALLGAQLGFALARRLDERALKGVFTVVLALAGLRVLLFSSALGGMSVLGPRSSLLLALAIGLLGGLLTPLLGVAGGIVMVPALFLLLGRSFAGLHDPTGFGGARACALAAGAVAALRALWLHARAGNVRYALGLPLAGGALLGALGGALAAHDPAFAHGGRILLGAVLLAQAGRFLRELRRSREAAPGAPGSRARGRGP